MGDPHGDPKTGPQHADPHGFLVWLSFFKKAPSPGGSAWSAGRHVDHPSWAMWGGEILLWPARKVTELQLRCRLLFSWPTYIGKTHTHTHTQTYQQEASIMWSFPTKIWQKNTSIDHITWCPSAFKTSTFGITWYDNFWPNLRLYRSSQNYYRQSCYSWECIFPKLPLPLPSWNSDEFPLPLPSWRPQSPLHFHRFPITILKVIWIISSKLPLPLPSWNAFELER